MTDELPAPADELLDVVDDDDVVIGRARRAEVYARRLCHRAVFILVRDAQGRVFAHRRSDHKLVFPGRYDLFVGGAVAAGESYQQAALREAEEELGVSGLRSPVPRLRYRFETVEYRWWCAIYEVTCELPVAPPTDEIAWYAFLSEEEIAKRIDEWLWCPDSLQAYQRLLALRDAAPRHT